MPVPVLAAPRANSVARVMAVTGSLFCLGAGVSQKLERTSSGWYVILGIYHYHDAEFCALVEDSQMETGHQPSL